jgi:hypothetical protein
LRQFECRIGPQGRGVIAILIAGSDHQHPEPDHLGKTMNHLALCSRILKATRQPIGNTKALFELPQHQNACIR